MLGQSHFSEEYNSDVNEVSCYHVPEKENYINWYLKNKEKKKKRTQSMGLKAHHKQYIYKHTFTQRAPFYVCVQCSLAEAANG